MFQCVNVLNRNSTNDPGVDQFDPSCKLVICTNDFWPLPLTVQTHSTEGTNFQIQLFWLYLLFVFHNILIIFVHSPMKGIKFLLHLACAKIHRVGRIAMCVKYSDRWIIIWLHFMNIKSLVFAMFSVKIAIRRFIDAWMMLILWICFLC